MKKAWMVVLLALVVRFGYAQDLSAREKRTYRTLSRVTLFAIGRIGYNGVISTGERAYRKLLRSPRAQTAFRAMLRDPVATAPVKLYALHGLRARGAKDFAEQAEPLLSHRGRIRVMHGCFGSDAAVSDIARNI